MPGIFQLLKHGWDLYTKHIRHYWIYLLILFIVSEASNLLNVFYGPTLGTVNAKNWQEIASYLIILIPTFLILFYVGLAFMSAMYGRLQKKSLDHPAIFSVSGRRLLASLGAYIMTSLTVIVGLLLIMLTVGQELLKLALQKGGADMTTLDLVGTAIGTILLIAGFILYIWFNFSYLEALLAGKNPIASIKGSYELVRTRWWQVFWRIFAPSFILAAFASLIATVIDRGLGGLALNLLGFNGALIFDLTIASLIGILIGPWGYGITLHLYQALKEKPVKK